MSRAAIAYIVFWGMFCAVGCGSDNDAPADTDSSPVDDTDSSDTTSGTTEDTTSETTEDTTPGTTDLDSSDTGSDSDNSDESFVDRATALVAGMTLEEKVSQMGHQAPSIQRLGIPAHNWWNEALHGVARSGLATVFPQAIALAGTFDPALIQEVSSIIATEARVKHNTTGKDLTYWSPTVNLARDPRWGRNEETYGEDPFLASRIAVAFVRGMQGDDPDFLKTVSTPKHFIANNEEARRHTGSSDVDERNLREHYMPAFKAAVMEGGAYSVMCAYNALNGIPSCANKWLLTDVLREEWGFKGYVVSDCGAIRDIVDNHHYVDSEVAASVAAITAGTDLNCGSRFQPDLVGAVQSGLIPETVVDTALIRLFTARYKLGLFEPVDALPFADIPDDELDSPAHQDLARKTARESMVLLKNDGLLPLDPSAIQSVAVIGPNADALVFGGYSGEPSSSLTPYRGIVERLSAVEATVDLAKGAALDGSTSDAELAAAVALAANSDVAIVVVGTNQEMTDEGRDRADIALPEPQEQLLEAIYAANPDTIAVLVTAAPLAISFADENLPAILNAWYGGQAAGEVIAEILFGDTNPSGRLPQTFYRSVDDLPPFDDYDIIGQKRTYMYFEGEVLYPFGHGLSYTTFDYSGLEIAPESVANDGTVTVSVTVENTGAMAGDEVVQVYVRDVEASVPTAMRKLKGFSRVSLGAGEKKTVSVDLDVSDFGFFDMETHAFVVEPGAFEIEVGASSRDIRLHGTLTVTPSK